MIIHTNVLVVYNYYFRKSFKKLFVPNNRYLKASKKSKCFVIPVALQTALLSVLPFVLIIFTVYIHILYIYYIYINILIYIYVNVYYNIYYIVYIYHIYQLLISFMLFSYLFWFTLSWNWLAPLDSNLSIYSFNKIEIIMKIDYYLPEVLKFIKWETLP